VCAAVCCCHPLWLVWVLFNPVDSSLIPFLCAFKVKSLEPRLLTHLAGCLTAGIQKLERNTHKQVLLKKHTQLQSQLCWCETALQPVQIIC
jgi:hypothetical protein